MSAHRRTHLGRARTRSVVLTMCATHTYSYIRQTRFGSSTSSFRRRRGAHLPKTLTILSHSQSARCAQTQPETRREHDMNGSSRQARKCMYRYMYKCSSILLQTMWSVRRRVFALSLERVRASSMRHTKVSGLCMDLCG